MSHGPGHGRRDVCHKALTVYPGDRGPQRAVFSLRLCMPSLASDVRDYSFGYGDGNEVVVREDLVLFLFCLVSRCGSRTHAWSSKKSVRISASEFVFWFN